MNIFRTAMAAALCLVAAIGMAQAQAKKPTQDEVKALTLKAAELVAAKGIDEAAKVFTTEGDFKYGEVYINVIDTQGNWVVFPPKPENKGKSVLNFVDEDGKELGKDILNTGLKGEGWTEYRWKNPATNTIQPKVTYVKRVPGKDLIVYSGIYK
ncbi:chemotaxis protein [Paramagnetospirillum marisnigri]|uniref:Chemotaxis protein n=1 Tax=Paramagnetospirillum marisnigri TaxID=1285242 RepID=A0A178MD67_9PROT|nr:cache domain-containing protein [Paramagnetospirillum marisnigri]OAN46751.1 chemotaxis protein [Paramagnetospirillum marisnigri]